MPLWIIIVALLSIALTALLTSVLMRVSGPAQQRKRDGGDSAIVPSASGSSGRDKDADSDSGSDGGGGDGGGD